MFYECQQNEGNYYEVLMYFFKWTFVILTTQFVITAFKFYIFCTESIDLRSPSIFTRYFISTLREIFQTYSSCSTRKILFLTLLKIDDFIFTVLWVFANYFFSLFYYNYSRSPVKIWPWPLLTKGDLLQLHADILGSGKNWSTARSDTKLTKLNILERMGAVKS